MQEVTKHWRSCTTSDSVLKQCGCNEMTRVIHDMFPNLPELIVWSGNSYPLTVCLASNPKKYEKKTFSFEP